MREPILLIDGDVSAYLACPPRWEAKATVVDEVSYVSLDDDGNKVIPDYTEEEDTRYLMMSYDNFKKQITEIRESLFITEENCLVAVAGKENYRKTMYDQYKMNRHKDPKKQNKFQKNVLKKRKQVQSKYQNEWQKQGLNNVRININLRTHSLNKFYKNIFQRSSKWTSARFLMSSQD